MTYTFSVPSKFGVVFLSEPKMYMISHVQTVQALGLVENPSMAEAWSPVLYVLL